MTLSSNYDNDASKTDKFIQFYVSRPKILGLSAVMLVRRCYLLAAFKNSIVTYKANLIYK